MISGIVRPFTVARARIAAAVNLEERIVIFFWDIKLVRKKDFDTGRRLKEDNINCRQLSWT